MQEPNVVIEKLEGEESNERSHLLKKKENPEIDAIKRNSYQDNEIFVVEPDVEQREQHYFDESEDDQFNESSHLLGTKKTGATMKYAGAVPIGSINEKIVRSAFQKEAINSRFDEPIITLTNDTEKGLPSSKPMQNCCGATGVYLLNFFSSVPAIAYGAVFGVSTLSQEFSAIYSARLFEGNPNGLKDSAIFPYLLILPSIAFMNRAVLQTRRNWKVIDKEIEALNKGTTWEYIGRRVKTAGGFLVFYPSKFLLAFTVALSTGVTFYASARFSANQLGERFDDSAFFHPTIAMATLAGAQSLMINTPKLIALIDGRGWIMSQYTNPRQHIGRQVLLKIVVNGMPLLSILPATLLTLCDAYQLSHHLLMSANEKTEIADRMAWAPAAILGFAMMIARFALNSCRFKFSLVEYIRSDKKFRDRFISVHKENCNVRVWHAIKTLLAAMITAGIATTSIVTFYGGANKFAYMVAYNQPPPVPVYPLNAHPSPFLFSGRLFVGILAFLPLTELLVTDGLEWAETLHLVKAREDSQKNNSPKGASQPIQSLIQHSMSLVGLAGLKLVVDFGLLFGRPAQEATWVHNLISASMLGAAAGTRYFCLELKKENVRLRGEHQSQHSVQANAANTAREMLDIEAAQKTETQETNNTLKKPPNHEGTSLFGNAVLLFLFTTFVGFSTQFAIRYGVLGDLNKTEAEQSLVTARLTSLIFAVLIGMYGISLIKKVPRLAAACSNFFKPAPNTKQWTQHISLIVPNDGQENPLLTTPPEKTRQFINR